MASVIESAMVVQEMFKKRVGLRHSALRQSQGQEGPGLRRSLLGNGELSAVALAGFQAQINPTRLTALNGS